MLFISEVDDLAKRQQALKLLKGFFLIFPICSLSGIKNDYDFNNKNYLSIIPQNI